MFTRRQLLCLAGASTPLLAPPAQAQDPFEGDPYKSFQWVEMKKEFIGRDARVQFDERVKVQGPAFAEDPMNVPITVQAIGIGPVERLMVLVDRNPIRKVLELVPLASQPALGFRFKLEQASPVRALALTKDGVWHVGGTWVDSSGGGCTAAGGSRKDGSWSTTLGQVNARLFSSVPGAGGPADAATRLRLRVMHPMDTGLVNGIPAFYIAKLSVRDAADRELARLATFEPVSENPVFSFDFAPAPRGPLRVVGVDNNGNRIDTAVN